MATLTVSLVRMLIPFMAHRLRPAPMLASAMLGTAGVFALYPLVHTPWLMVARQVLPQAQQQVLPQAVTATTPLHI